MTLADIGPDRNNGSGKQSNPGGVNKGRGRVNPRATMGEEVGLAEKNGEGWGHSSVRGADGPAPIPVLSPVTTAVGSRQGSPP